MLDYLLNLNPILLAFIATLFTWSFTCLGASIVFFFKKNNKFLEDAMLGVAGGIMLSASFFSLLNPAINMSNNLTNIFIGFLCGGLFLFLGDYIFKKCSKSCKNKRIIFLFSSITIHNIPEGLVVGVAFGGLINGNIMSALLLTLGIALQNFPEGTAISLPLKRENISSKKSFFYGSLSGIVEPISGVIGAVLVMKVNSILPFLMTFAAGAMIYVVIEEIIPESQKNKKKDLMTLFTCLGFLVMMILDVVFG